jgi:hypothetical protein
MIEKPLFDLQMDMSSLHTGNCYKFTYLMNHMKDEGADEEDKDKSNDVNNGALRLK